MSDREPRERKSWREVDRARDQGAHRREDRVRQTARPNATAVSQYKRELDKVFGNREGAVGARVRKMLPAIPPGGSERQSLLRTIREATSRTAISEAAKRFAEKGYSWPDDLEVQVQLLEHTDESVVRATLDRIEQILEREPIRRKALLQSRLRKLAELTDDAEIRDRAQAVRNRVG